MDLSDLTKWQFGVHGNANLVSFDGEDIRPVATFIIDENAKKAAMSFRAFEIMIRLGWSVRRSGDTEENLWMVDCGWNEWFSFDFGMSVPTWNHPVTAVIEAYEWYKENVEDKRLNISIQ